MRRLLVVLAVLVSTAAVSGAGTAKGEFLFPHLFECGEGLQALPPGGGLLGDRSAAYMKTWDRISKVVTWTLEQTGPNTVEITVTGDLTVMPVDRLLDMLAREHYVIAVMVDFRRDRQKRISELEMAAHDTKLKAEVVEEKIRQLRATAPGIADPVLALESSAHLAESLREQHVQVGVELAAAKGMLSKVREETQKLLMNGKRTPTQNAILDGLQKRRVEIEVEMAGHAARAEALSAAHRAELARRDELGLLAQRMDELETERERYVEQKNRFYGWLEELVTSGTTDPRPDAVPVRLDRPEKK